MASADSLPPLGCRVSPGKVRELSPRADGLYPPRFFDSLRTSLSLASSSPVTGLNVRSCSCGRGFAFRFFQLRLTATRRGSAAVAAISSDDLLSDHKFTPMLGTLGTALRAVRPSLEFIPYFPVP